MNLPKFDKFLASNPKYLTTNEFIVTHDTRAVSLTDVERRNALRSNWEKNAEEIRNREQSLTDDELSQIIFRELGSEPQALTLGETIVDEYKTGGKAIFWSDGVIPYDIGGNELVLNSEGRVVAKLIQGRREFIDSDRDSLELFDPAQRLEEELEPGRIRVTNRYKSLEELQRLGVVLRGKGRFEMDFLLYKHLNVDLNKMSNGTLETLRLPTRLFLPFIFMILLSFITPKGDSVKLDRYFVKMKTPVDPDPEKDAEEMRLSYENPHRFDDKRLFKRWGLEINRPTIVDVVGFLTSFVICIGVVWLIVVVANYQP